MTKKFFFIPILLTVFLSACYEADKEITELNQEETEAALVEEFVFMDDMEIVSGTKTITHGWYYIELIEVYFLMPETLDPSAWLAEIVLAYHDQFGNDGYDPFEKINDFHYASVRPAHRISGWRDLYYIEEEEVFKFVYEFRD